MIERALVEYLANALWQIPLLAGGAWLLLAAVKAGPRMQHGVWLAVLGLAVVLPLHGMRQDEVVAVQSRSAGVAPREEIGGWVETRELVAQSSSFAGRAGRMQSAIHPRRVVVSQATARWMVGLYAGIVMFGLYRVMSAWRAARGLVEAAREISLAGEQTVVLEDYGRRLRIRLPEVRESVEVSSPMIVGVAAPVLLLPEGFSEHGRQEMRAALLHELAHVKRRDYLVNALCQMVALPVVWHPVTHWVLGRVRRTREMVCDAMAAEEMQSEIGYARCLLALAKSMLGGQELDGHAAGAGLFSHNVLEERVMRLMETKAAMRMRTKVFRVASGATAMVAATAMAVMFHVTPTMAASNATTATPQSETATLQTQPASTGVANPDAATAQESQSRQKKHVGETTNTYVRSGKHCDGKTYAIVNGVRRPLTAEEKAKLDEALARAQAKIAAAKAKIDSPEFRRQIEDAQRKAVEAEAKINSPEFQQRIAEAQKKAEEAAAKIDSPEFRKQMEDAQKVTENLKVALPQIQLNIREAIAQINSPKFRKQIEEAQKINMAEVQRQIDEATRQLNDTIDMNIKIK